MQVSYNTEMSQLKYDIAEFMVNNRDEIITHLQDEMSHLSFIERIFDNAPEVYDELHNNHRKSKLTHYLANHFPNSFEEISLILDDEFIKMTLHY